MLLYQYCYMDAKRGRWLSLWRNSLTAITQECYEQYWTVPGANTTQNSSCPAITKTTQIRRTRHVGHCWRSKDELMIDVLLWILSHEWTKIGRPPTDKGIDDRDEWRERMREIRVSSKIWWCLFSLHIMLLLVPLHTYIDIYIFIIKLYSYVRLIFITLPTTMTITLWVPIYIYIWVLYRCIYVFVCIYMGQRAREYMCVCDKRDIYYDTQPMTF